MKARKTRLGAASAVPFEVADFQEMKSRCQNDWFKPLGPEEGFPWTEKQVN
jgi:hypothetical protein